MGVGFASNFGKAKDRRSSAMEGVKGIPKLGLANMVADNYSIADDVSNQMESDSSENEGGETDNDKIDTE